jgi:predicted amidohydrolase YtcJ
MRRMRLILAATSLWLVTGCGGRSDLPVADTIFTNATFYSVDVHDSVYTAMAVRDGAILALGADLTKYRGENTQLVDLKGQFVMPGIQDMHLHPVDGGIKGRFECTFGDTLTADEIVQAVAACIALAEPGTWIQGGQWGAELLEDNPTGLLEKLDSVSPDHPVFLIDWALHNAWVNTRALTLLGIDDHTPDPKGGVILRDGAGRANGILLDNAAYAARQQLPDYTVDQVVQALEFSQEQMLSHGITAYKDAIVTERNLAAYHRMVENGGLKLRAKAALAWKSAWSKDHATEVALTDNHVSHARERLDTRYAKIMLDGIPPTYTAAVLEPYEPSAQFGDAHFGKLMLEPAELAEDVTRLDALGLTVKMHATGDRSLRMALDAVEAARRANGDSGLRHEVSHAEMIHPDDLPRFAELNVSAEMCPILWYPSPAVDAMRAALGERADRFWPVRSLVESGAHVFYGSDWPSVVPDTNPWPGIEAMVTRKDPYGQYPGVFWPEQAVDLATAIRIFTFNSAIAGRHEAHTGSLEVGKRADFIVLDRNPFEIPADTLGDVQVLGTYIDGVSVWSR